MNYCTHCGASLDGAINFCKNCGEKLDKGNSLALSEKTPSAEPADRKKLAQGKKLAFILGAGAAVLALALVLVFTVFLNKPETEQPLTVAQLLDLGEKYLLDLDYEQALVQFMAVVEIEPKNERGYTGAAEAYIGLGETDRAAQILQDGFDRTSNAEIERMLGEFLSAEGGSATVGTAQTPSPTPEQEQTEVQADTEAAFPAAQVGDIIEFGSYDWRVLDVRDGKALVISEYVISERRYHGDMSGIIDWWDIETTWADSDIRVYLNGTFYNSFNDVDRERITQTQIANNDNPWFGTPGGADTQDYIFLLSIDELVRYFGDSGQLANRPNDESWINDEYNQARVAYDMNDNNQASVWWLRSPGATSHGAAIVAVIGGIVVVGYGVAHDTGGVRPAMWLKLE